MNVKELKELVEQGNADAQYELGVYFDEKEISMKHFVGICLPQSRGK